MQSTKRIMLTAALLLAVPLAQAADGGLDPTFGVGGKVQLSLADATGVGVPGSIVATDVAVQADGKILVAGYYDYQNGSSQVYGWIEGRLNANGSADTSFGGYGTGFSSQYGGGHIENQARAIVVRPNGKIVVGGTLKDDNNGRVTSVVIQLNADGSFDHSWGASGQVYLTPAAGDASSTRAIVLDSDGTVDVAGTYYNNLGGFNSNEFFFDRIAADGSGHESFQYELGSGSNQDSHATGLAIDSQGRYVVVGYTLGTYGYDCAAVRIRRDLYDVDNTFGSGGQTTVAFDLASNDNDVCNAVAIIPTTGSIVLGGQSTAPVGGNAYVAAALAALDSNGNLFSPARFTFSYNLNPSARETNGINKLIVDGYDSRYPQILAIGSGNQNATPPGVYFGIARLNPAAFGSNFSFDPGLNGKGVEGVYFSGTVSTLNYASSAVFVNDKLIAVGSTYGSNGDEIAVTRLAAFDGIFKNGFDPNEPVINAPIRK